MKREKALTFLREHLPKENLIKHSLAVEACMVSLADKFGENREEWALAGLLHDLDYRYTEKEPERHGLVTEEYLRPLHINENVIHAIKAHNHHVEPQSRMDLALLAVDPTTGFIIACALMHPSRKLENVDLKRMKKRFREKNFARGADRDQISSCHRLGLELDDFLMICLHAMQGIHQKLGL